MRKARIERNTNETKITVEIDIDGTGEYDIKTGIGFFDHMLEQLSRHSLVDIRLSAYGDLHVDFHHTVEDTGIALGQAFRAAVDSAVGIERYACAYVPLDEALSRVVVDFSGRPYLVWKVDFPSEKVGQMDTELFREFFQAFVSSAGIALHVENLYGSNNHHIIESCYKAFARAIRKALSVDSRSCDSVPSTKGTLFG